MTSNDEMEQPQETQLAEAKQEEEDKRINLQRLQNISWEVGFHGGLNKMLINDQSSNTNLAALRNQYVQGDWGYTAGLDVRMLWKGKWSINTGVSYQNLWSKLDYSKTLTQDSVLQVVVIDSAGQVLDMTYGSASRTFNAQWNNQYITYRIPLNIGFQQNTKNWLYGGNLGVIFNITTGQKGWTFNNEEKLAAFAKGDDHTTLNPIQIGFSASPFIGYALTDKWVMRLSPSWNWYRGNTGTVQDFNLNIGIGLRF